MFWLIKILIVVFVTMFIYYAFNKISYKKKVLKLVNFVIKTRYSDPILVDKINRGIWEDFVEDYFRDNEEVYKVLIHCEKIYQKFNRYYNGKHTDLETKKYIEQILSGYGF